MNTVPATAWTQVSVTVEGARAEAIEDMLEALGAVSVTLQDAADEAVFQLDRDSTPLWQQVIATGLFPADSDTAAVCRQITVAFHLDSAQVRAEAVVEQDWERAWMADFHPVRFGRRLWVCPSWTEPPVADAVNIMLDPGLAFGSGTHPTTALCLEWLDATDLRGLRIIDYGCGSGILGIAAARLGAAHVLAVDNDPQALTATESNRLLNDIPEEQLSVSLPFRHDETPVDILVANILSGPLESLMPILARLIRPGGRLLLSGVLSEQTAPLLSRYALCFDMREPVRRQEWICVEGRRLDNPA